MEAEASLMGSGTASVNALLAARILCRKAEVEGRRVLLPDRPRSLCAIRRIEWTRKDCHLSSGQRDRRDGKNGRGAGEFYNRPADNMNEASVLLPSRLQSVLSATTTGSTHPIPPVWLDIDLAAVLSMSSVGALTRSSSALAPAKLT